MRPKFLLFAAFVIALVLVWLSVRQQKQSNILLKSTIQNSQSASVMPVSNAPAASQKKNGIFQTNVAVSTNQAIVVYDRKKTNEIRQYMESQNKPIDFYGQVIDQDGNPLAGVSIKGEALRVKVVVPAAWGDKDEIIPIAKETDAAGRFEIQGITGRAVELESIQKSGYEAEPVKRAWKSTEGTLESPVIFRMWSANIHEQLITGEKRFRIAPDGRTYAIDLTKGTIDESGDGDLRVWVKRPDPIVFGQRYDWACELDVANGGLLQETDSFSSMFSAPVEGYLPSFRFDQKVGSGWGDSTGSKRFYLMLKNGQAYGRITIELYAYYNDRIPGLIVIKYAINPSGSRILRP